MSKDYCPYWQNQFCQHKEFEQMKNTIDEIKGIAGIPNLEKLKYHNLREGNLPDAVRYQILERVRQNRNAEDRCLQEEIKNDSLKEENKQLREVLKKASCGTIACRFCNNPIRIGHKDDCEYVRLTRESEGEV